MIGTKGEMTKILKRFGIRKAETPDGRTVKLEHLKYPDLCVLFDEFEKNFKPGSKGFGTGDAEKWRSKLYNSPFEV